MSSRTPDDSFLDINDAYVTARQRRLHSPDTSLSLSLTDDDSFGIRDEANVTRRRRRRQRHPSIGSPISFTESPIRSIESPESPIRLIESPERSTHVTPRRPRRRGQDIDLDALNMAMLHSPEEMDVQHIDLPVLRRENTRRRRRRGQASDVYDTIVNVGLSEPTEESQHEWTEEEIEELNRRRLERIEAESTFPIEDFDKEGKHVELPVVEIPLKTTEISVYDFLNISETPLKAFLEEDGENIAFKYHTQQLWMGVDRDSLAQNLKNPSQIKYECLTLRDVNGDVAYFQLRGIGFPAGVVDVREIGAILRDTHRMYELVPSDKVLNRTLSYGHYHYHLPTSDMCSPESKVVVYNIRRIRSPAETGGKAKKRATRKRKQNNKKSRKNTKK